VPLLVLLGRLHGVGLPGWLPGQATSLSCGQCGPSGGRWGSGWGRSFAAVCACLAGPCSTAAWGVLLTQLRSCCLGKALSGRQQMEWALPAAARNGEPQPQRALQDGTLCSVWHPSAALRAAELPEPSCCCCTCCTCCDGVEAPWAMPCWAQNGIRAHAACHILKSALNFVKSFVQGPASWCVSSVTAPSWACIGLTRPHRDCVAALHCSKTILTESRL
jgi:hypothetical protein